MEQASPHVSFIILGETSNGDPSPVALSASAFVEHAAGAFEWIRCEGEDAAARRDALSRARGTFVAFIDASDRLHPDLWTYVEGATAGPDVDVIYTDQDTFDDNGYRDPFLKPA